VSAAFPRKYTRTYEFYAEIPPLLLPRLRRTRARGSRLFAIKIRESLSNNVCRRCLTAYRSSSRSRSRASRVLAGVGSIKGTLIVAAGEQWRHRNYSSDAAGAASRVRACIRTSGMPSGAKARARARARCDSRVSETCPHARLRREKCPARSPPGSLFRSTITRARG